MSDPPAGGWPLAPPPADSPPSPVATVLPGEPTPPPTPDADGRRRKRRGWKGTAEWVVILAVALLGAFLIRTFLVQAFFIPSESMTPTLKVDDRVLVNKLSYRLHSVHRGDVVVFTHSPGFDPNIKDLIKRVIGLPGERVEGRAGHIFINGQFLNEPYLPPGTPTSDFGPRLIPAHSYWVMGDNRTNSTDSRVFGPITSHQIVGRAFVLVWPLNRIKLL